MEEMIGPPDDSAAARFGKLGIGAPEASGYHDGGVVERWSPTGKRIRYAAVILQANALHPTLDNLAIGLDNIILSQHRVSML